MTTSTPSISSSGKASPASTTSISSSNSTTKQFLPISFMPPSGMTRSGHLRDFAAISTSLPQAQGPVARRPARRAHKKRAQRPSPARIIGDAGAGGKSTAPQFRDLLQDFLEVPPQGLVGRIQGRAQPPHGKADQVQGTLHRDGIRGQE